MSAKFPRGGGGEQDLFSSKSNTIAYIYVVPFDGAHGIGVQTRYKNI